MYQQPITMRPPSSRNREIFRAVRGEMKSFRDAAKEFKLSKTRVGNIIKQVEKWIGTTAAGNQGTTWLERLCIMEEIHRLRLDHLYAQALEGWQKSREDLHIQKLTQIEGKPDKRELTIKTTPGDRRFLESALKIEESRWKFEEHSEQLQPEPRELENGPPKVPEVEPYWRPWQQTDEEIAKRRARIEKFVRDEGITDFNGTHIDVVRMEMLMADKENAARASNAAKAAGDGDWGLGAGDESAELDERTNSGTPTSTPIPSPVPSPQPPAPVLKKPTIHLMTVTPIVPSANRKRALMHPNDRPPRCQLPGWEW